MIRNEKIINEEMEMASKRPFEILEDDFEMGPAQRKVIYLDVCINVCIVYSPFLFLFFYR
jgi:hypothetical protein